MHRAIEFVQESEGCFENEKRVCDCFIRYKVSLVQSNVDCAVEQLDAMMSCKDFQLDMIEVGFKPTSWCGYVDFDKAFVILNHQKDH